MMLDYDASNYACAPGFFSSSCDGFKITVNGKGCHGAMPHLGIDPINVGMSICTAFQQLVSRETPPKETASLTFGQFSGGNTPNIVPDKVVIQGTLRTYNAELRALEMGYAAGTHQEMLFATGVVLFLFIIIINLVLTKLTSKGVDR